MNYYKDIGISKIKAQEQNIVFTENYGKYLGKFFVNKNGVFDFEGDCTESAKMFVEEVKRQINLKYI
tara:strand:- start:1261 stop:1461 length:201 start_codon:yes stop_codon:yes gene_type:complete